MRALLLLLILSTPLTTAAQYEAQPRAALTWGAAPWLRASTILERLPDTYMAQSPKKKSAGIAFLLGVYVPGLGSLYAGNQRHFFRHLGLALVVIPAGALFATTLGPVGFGVAIFGWMANYFWSIGVALNDVKIHNERIAVDSGTNSGVRLLRLRL